jgi:hypothetical protein
MGQELDSTMWVTNGAVNSIAQSGNTIYVGGEFTYVGPHTGAGAVIDPNSGKTSAKFPAVDGHIYSSLADGKGGWYIGGVFTKVGAIPRNNIAHITRDFEVDQNFHPDVLVWGDRLGSQYGGGVNAMALSGDTLFIGGNFSEINKQKARNLAAFNTVTGAVFDWHLNQVGVGEVASMAIAGSRLFVAGQFSSYDDKGNLLFNKQLVAFDTKTSHITDFRIEADDEILQMGVVGNELYVSGRFMNIAGKRRGGIASIDTQTGLVTEWDIHNAVENAYTKAMTVNDETVFVTGYFILDGNSKDVLIIDHRTKSVKSWYFNSFSQGLIESLAFLDQTLYLGGTFEKIMDYPRANLFAIDINTGAIKDWNPFAGGAVKTLSISNGKIFAGGLFASIGGTKRNNLVALDATNGTALPWDPNPDSWVASIGIYKDLVYVGGGFRNIGGKERNSFAAVNIATGQANELNLNISQGYPFKIISSGSTLYLLGIFNSIGGQTRNYIAALDAVSGKITDWNPEVDDLIYTLLVSGNKIYIGGFFDYIKSVPRRRLGCIDRITGEVTDWRCDVESDAAVSTLVEWGGNLYVSGAFTRLGGEDRNRLASVDTLTGKVLVWNPNSNGFVPTLTVHKNTIFAGGLFTSIGEKPRSGLAAINPLTGIVHDWSPNGYGEVQKLLTTNNQLFVGLGGRLWRESIVPYINKGLLAFVLQPYEKPNVISGRIYEKKNNNCEKAEIETTTLPNYVVKVEPGSYYGLSDANGNYSIKVGKGRYTVNQVLSETKGLLVKTNCPVGETYTISFDSTGQEKSNIDFGNQVTKLPFLKVEVAADRRRRCFSGSTTIHYRNEGFASASNVQVQVTYPQYVIPLAASTRWSSRKDSILTFDLGTLQAGQSGSITLSDSVICGNESIRGLTQCVKAVITPKNNLKAPDPNWDKSDMALKAVCKNNGFVRLTLLNTGAGAMSDSASFRIYLDAVKVFEGQYKLAAKDSLSLEVPANGRTVRLEADLRPFHPDGNRQPSITLEGCGRAGVVTISKGFVNQLPQDDAPEEVAISCLPILDSYDPNDKQASPVGVGPQHLITEKDELEYLIRFQNTGTDLAYNVVVTDTLDEHLDIVTLQMGAASHPFTWKLSGQGRPVITWIFNNINLPDSTSNEPKSHGYLRFRIGQKADNSLGTIIANQAAITFDYNSPILTNLTTHTVGEIPQQLSSTAVDVCKGHYPTLAQAGMDTTLLLISNTKLRANVPKKGYGQWKLISGKASIAEPNNPKSAVTGLGAGKNVLEWTITLCDSVSRSRVTLERTIPAPQTANPDAVCAGDPVPTLTAIGTNLIWYGDAQLTQKLAQGASFRPASAGAYFVTQTVDGYLSKASQVNVTIHPRPAAPAVVSNPRVYCQGESIEPLEAMGENLRWYADAPLKQLVGTGYMYQPLVSVSSSFYVTQTVANCEGSASRVALTIQPAKIMVEAKGDTLMAPEGSTFQWYYEGKRLEKATSKQYLARNTGHYHVSMKKESCPVESEPVLVTVNVPHSILTLTPNPSPDRVEVTLTTQATGQVEMRMYNTLGRLVYQTAWHKPTTILTEEFNIAQLPRGMYFVEISTQQETLIRKIIKN